MRTSLSAGHDDSSSKTVTMRTLRAGTVSGQPLHNHGIFLRRTARDFWHPQYPALKPPGKSEILDLVTFQRMVFCPQAFCFRSVWLSTSRTKTVLDHLSQPESTNKTNGNLLQFNSRRTSGREYMHKLRIFQYSLENANL